MRFTAWKDFMKDQKLFYTAEPDDKSVTRKEFEKFLKEYPRKLERDVFGAFEPPLVTYNDFELANRWPFSTVASTFLYTDDQNDPWYEPEDKRAYRIVTNHEELFATKTGYIEE